MLNVNDIDDIYSGVIKIKIINIYWMCGFFLIFYFISLFFFVLDDNKYELKYLIMMMCKLFGF